MKPPFAEGKERQSVSSVTVHHVSRFMRAGFPEADRSVMGAARTSEAKRAAANETAANSFIMRTVVIREVWLGECIA